jgi:hypothetical protein
MVKRVKNRDDRFLSDRLLVQPGVKEPGIRRQGPCPDKSSETAEPSFG